MGRYRKLTDEKVAKMRRLIKDFPDLTNYQIGELVGCSDSTVGAERRGTRTVRTDERRASFEAAKAAMGAAPPRPAPTLPSMEDEPEGALPAAANFVEEQARTLAAEIRIQALKKLRMKLTNGEIEADDVLAALGDR